MNHIYSQDDSVVTETGVGPQENEGVGEIRLKWAKLWLVHLLNCLITPSQ